MLLWLTLTGVGLGLLVYLIGAAVFAAHLDAILTPRQHAVRSALIFLGALAWPVVLPLMYGRRIAVFICRFARGRFIS